jgi:hypothetical protein
MGKFLLRRGQMPREPLLNRRKLSMNKQELYIGYLPRMSRRLAGFVATILVCIFIAGFFVAYLFNFAQKEFASSYFDFLNEQTFEGILHTKPFPYLMREEPVAAGSLPKLIRYPLVGEGKHGIGEAVSQFENRKVRFKGKLIYRDDMKMIEAIESSIEDLSMGETGNNPTRQSLGEMILRGEIVDSKCYLGVMNPGATKVHRACAVRCISGGIPALFIVKNAEGQSSALWLISRNGEQLSTELLDYVAEPIEISGEVSRLDDQLFFAIDPHKISRLP